MLQLQYFHQKYDPSDSSQMHKSVVVKARVEDLETTEAAIFDLTDSLGTCFEQEDVYFNVPRGHLKLRIMHPNRCGQLIFNSCSKLSGHKYSEAQVTEVEDVYNIRATLGAALGELGTIRKKRRIFITDDVRIYLDDVDEIGQFIDVAVTMSSAADKEACCKRASEIRRVLNISDQAIVPAAYLDMLIRKCSFDESDASSAQETSDPDDTTGDSDGST